MNRKYIIGAITIVLLLGTGGFFFWNGYPREKSQEVVSEQPLSQDAIFGLVLSDENGNSVTLADYKGKNLIMAAWATWSPYSGQELEALAAVKGEYGETLTAIAVNRGESREAARAYLLQKNHEGTLRYFFDPDDSFFKAIGGFSMPETIFIDKNSEVRFHKRGPMNREELRRRAQDIFGI